MRAHRGRGDRPTFTERARREQIVAAAIEVIAEIGFTRASFARIAEHAGLSSTGLISYHFRAKSDLVNQVITTVYEQIGDYVGTRVRATTTAREALRVYIEANVAFAATHRRQMKALLSIFLGGASTYDGGSEQEAISGVAEVLRWGQRSGEFRPFDVRVMATVIQRSIEGPTFLMDSDPEFDADAYARELVATFDRATTAES